MNGRMLLLVLVTGMFMAAWNGDQAAMQAALARRADQQAALVAAHGSASQPASQDKAVARRQSVRTVSLPRTESSEKQPQQAIQNMDAPSIQLPAVIAAGTYRAVSQRGQTVQLIIPKTKASSDPPQDLYISDSPNGDRWFLIRITP